MAKSSGEEGLARRGPWFDWREALALPRDRRGIVLACGFLAAAAFGLATLVSIGDPIGWAYLALAGVGYFYIETRGLPTFLWLLVAAGGAAVALGGNPSGWIECGLGVALAVVAMLPVASTSDAASPRQRQVAEATSAASDSPALADPTRVSAINVGVEVTARPKVSIRACGALSLRIGDTEIAGRLEPRLEFLLSYLMTRHVLGHVATDRLLVAEEIAPGISQKHKLDRLRKQLHELQVVDPALTQLVKADRHKVWLRLDQIDCDVVRLLELAKRIAADDALIDSAALADVSAVLEATSGEFLVGFESLEQQVTRGQTGAGNVVRDARLALGYARADLVRALANHHVAAGHAEAAIPYLIDALEGSLAHQDLARLLVAAYLQTGQMSRAREARHEYGLTEES